MRKALIPFSDSPIKLAPTDNEAKFFLIFTRGIIRKIFLLNSSVSELYFPAS